jgi:hypothetical protein
MKENLIFLNISNKKHAEELIYGFIDNERLIHNRKIERID